MWVGNPPKYNQAGSSSFNRNHFQKKRRKWNENITDEQSVWKYLKYEMRKFSKKFSKEAARSKKTESSDLETKLKFQNWLKNNRKNMKGKLLKKIFESFEKNA